MVALKYKVVGKTDVGLVRSGNEDYLHLDEANSVFAVCDGMGGHQAGEVASMTASGTISTVFTHVRKELLCDPDLALDQSLPESGELLIKSIRLANRSVFNRSASDPTLAGMGTTVVAVALEDDVMSIAHVGDSRAYRLEDKRLIPLTTDHSWVAEMRQQHLISEDQVDTAVGKNVITRALGVRANVEVDYRLIKVKAGDIFVLCSDGLCGFADDDEIFAVADRARPDIMRITGDLVRMANDRGGTDNVTVIAIEILEIEPSANNEVDVFTMPAESDELLGIEDAWLARMEKLETEDNSPSAENSQVSASGNKLLLTIIFATFAVLAAVIVYFSAIR